MASGALTVHCLCIACGCLRVRCPGLRVRCRGLRVESNRNVKGSEGGGCWGVDLVSMVSMRYHCLAATQDMAGKCSCLKETKLELIPCGHLCAGLCGVSSRSANAPSVIDRAMNITTRTLTQGAVVEAD